MFNTSFHDYQAMDPPRRSEMAYCSPALSALMRELRSRWGCSSLGCFGLRAVRGGTRPSSHSFGAAIDVSFKDDADGATRLQLCAFLVAWSSEWGIQAVHDYQGSRIWRAGRTSTTDDACTLWWKAQRKDPANGMGQRWAHWLHVEVHPGAWFDDRDGESRGVL
jgi:hypothetical protein